MADRKTNPLRPIMLVVGGIALLVLLAGVYFAGRISAASASTPAPTIVPSPMPSPTPKIEFGPVVIKQIQSMPRLQTAKYTLEQVIVREKPPWFLWTLGGQKLLLIVQGTVTAGIDMDKISTQDVKVSEATKTVHIKLPPAEIFESFLVDSETRIYDYDKGLLGATDEKLIEDTRKQGLDQIIRAACKDGILDSASKDAQLAMLQLLAPMGLQVEFDQTPPSPCPVMPEPTATAK